MPTAQQRTPRQPAYQHGRSGVLGRYLGLSKYRHKWHQLSRTVDFWIQRGELVLHSVTQLVNFEHGENS